MTVNAGPQPPPQVSVPVATVSGNDLLTSLQRQAETMARVETKVDGIPAQITDIAHQGAANAEAIGVLRQKWAFLQGIGVVVSFILGSVDVVALVVALRR